MGFFSSQWNFDGLEGILWVFLLTISWIYMHLLTGFQYGSPNSGVTKKMLLIMMSMKEFPSVRYHSMNFHQLVSPLLNRDIAMCSQLSQILKNYSSSFFNVSLNSKMTRNAIKHFYMESYAFWRKLMELYGVFSSQWNFYGIRRNLWWCVN